MPAKKHATPVITEMKPTVKPKKATTSLPAEKTTKVKTKKKSTAKTSARKTKKSQPIKHSAPIQKSHSHRQVLFFVILFVVGINMIIAGILYSLYQKTILSFQATPVTTVELANRRGEVTHVQVPSQNIDLDVVTASIRNGIWDTSDVAATHLDTSARPGEGGNVVVYGHNRFALFGKIRDLRPNDTVLIKSSEGRTYEYTVTDVHTVDPSQVEYVLPTTHEELTLYTCTGLFDSKRFVVKAIPTKVTTW